ncbi:hypothetical protein Aperf_G00000035407 [Anoplocephala perfoliata]
MDYLPILKGLREFYGVESFEYSERKDGSIEGYFESAPILSELYLKVRKPIPTKQRLIVTKQVEEDDDYVIYEIEILPRVYLTFEIHPDLPGSISFSLHCAWLDDEQTAAVLKHLQMLCENGFLDCSLSDSFTFIEHELLPFLFPDVVINKTVSPRSPHIVTSILEYNEEYLRKVLPDRIYECNVCFDSVRGSRCFRFSTCGHLFCRSCIRQSFEASINSGIQEDSLQCLECKTEVPEFEIRELLSKSMYKKYDKVLLSKALQQMPDVIQCPMPNCLTNVILLSPKLAKCPNCDFAFCPKCKRAYHGNTDCTLSDPLLIAEIVAIMEGDDEELKRDCYGQYGKEALEKILNEYYSTQYIKEKTQKCPKCQANVQREYGCCVMHCLLCNQVFCWLCLEKLNPGSKYDHFKSGSCGGKLFDAHPMDEDQNEAYL